MQWSSQQDKALLAVRDWYNGPDQLFYLAGYAGSGKTTLAKHFAEDIEGIICYGAFTGKAAYVMAQKGCVGATTIHRMIYKPKDKSRERLKELQDELMRSLDFLKSQDTEAPESNPKIIQLRSQIAQEEKNLKRPIFDLNYESIIANAALTIIDECSMIDQRIGEDLLSFGSKVLVLGDPAQLPPVHGSGYFTSRTPDFQLTEIHRQAQDNPIIKLATSVRQGRKLEIGRYGESEVLDWADVTREHGIEADQIIVGTNKLRRGTNAKMREVLGRNQSCYPLKEDRLVCLRNNHDVGLLNGSIWTAENSLPDPDTGRVFLQLRGEDGQKLECEAHGDPFLGQEVPWYEKKEAQEFDFGYAMTGHKSQGSQWDHVLIFDQSRTFQRDANKWLYTAITRAAETVKIVVP